MRCEDIRVRLSELHDSGAVDPAVAAHLARCDACRDFAEELVALDRLLAAGDVSRAPDLGGGIRAATPRVAGGGAEWWSVAAVALLGLVIGALVSGVGARIGAVSAADLPSLYDSAGARLTSLSAELVIVERGWHPAVGERTYRGSLDYAAPERLALSLVDLTEYPSDRWPANDVRVIIDDGTVARNGRALCRVEAMPDCLAARVESVLHGVKPFDEGTLQPLEAVAPADTLAFAAGHTVLGETELDGRRVIQVQTTVAAASTIGALLDTGNWRELYPSDPALVWFDAEYLVPIRTEVFAADDADRALWALRHGYEDRLDAPILIVELADVDLNGEVEIALPPTGGRSAGFADRPVDVPTPDLEGYELHRQGSWWLPAGGRVDLAAWSDGRDWVTVEVTDTPDEDGVFGIPGPFVTVTEDGRAGTLYVDPAGRRVAIHGATGDVVVTGSISTGELIEAAAGLGVRGSPAPGPAPTPSLPTIDHLMPAVEGWSAPVIRQSGDIVRMVLVGAGDRSVVIEQSPAGGLEPAIGPDVTGVTVRGAEGRYSAGTGRLEWVENGRRVVMLSDTVGRSELIAIADGMAER